MIITNNPKVHEMYSKKMNCEYVDGDNLKVLVKVRDLIHGGYKLLTHPLYGSIKPNETPYRTIILEDKKGVGLDYESLKIIDSSIDVTKKFRKIGMRFNVEDQGIMDDFADIDLVLIKSAIDSRKE